MIHLASFVPSFWFYGFLGAYFTHSLWLSLGIAAILWWMSDVVGALHPENSRDAIVALNFLAPVSLVTGVIVGLLAVWAFQLVPLLDIELWRIKQGTTAAGDDATNRGGAPVWVFEQTAAVFLLALITLLVGIDFLAERYDLSSTVSLTLGVVLIVLGGGALLVTLVRWYKSAAPADWLNFGYSLAFLFFGATSVVYNRVERPNNGWIFQIALFFVFLFTVLLSKRFFRRLTPEVAAALSHSDVRGSMPRQWSRWLVLYVPTALVYLLAWLVDVYTEAGLEQVLLAVTLLSLLIEFTLVLLGWWWWRRSTFKLRWVSDEEEAKPPARPSQAPAPVPSQLVQRAPNTQLDAMKIKRTQN